MTKSEYDGIESMLEVNMALANEAVKLSEKALSKICDDKETERLLRDYYYYSGARAAYRETCYALCKILGKNIVDRTNEDGLTFLQLMER